MRLKQSLPSLFLFSLVALTINTLAASDGAITWLPPPDLDITSLFLTYMRSLVSIVVVAVMVATVALLVARRRVCIELMKQAVRGQVRSDRRKNSLLNLMVVSMFSALVLFSAMFWRSIPVLREPQTPTSPVPSLSPTPSSDSISPSWLFLPQPSDPPSLAFGQALTIIFLALASIALAITLQALREIGEEAIEERQLSVEEETMRASAVGILQEALESFWAEEDLRAVVIRCYRRLCEILARHGVAIQNNQTVREFEAAVLNALEVPRRSLVVLTSLFEEARYSLHEIDDARRDEALKCLADIKDYLLREGRHE